MFLPVVLAAAALPADARLRVVAALAARGGRARSPVPAGLRADHSALDLPPVHADEAAIDVTHFA